MIDLSHLDALRTRLTHERGYLASAKSDRERRLRTVWICQVEREIAAEHRHLGVDPVPELALSDDDLLAELGP